MISRFCLLPLLLFLPLVAADLVPSDPEKGKEGFDLPAVAAAWTPTQREALLQLAGAAGAEAYRGIKDAADAALTVAPQPQAVLSYEGLLPDHPARVETVERLQDIGRLRVLGYAWLVEDDPRYAAHAATIIRAWADTYQPTGNAINENKFASLIGAYGLLRAEHFDASQRTAIDRWLGEIGHQLKRTGERDRRMTNWHSKRIKIAAAIGTVIGDEDLVDWARSELTAYIAVGLHPDGSSEDFRRRDALSYHSGGLQPLLEILQALGPEGHVLYRQEFGEGSSVAKSVAFMRRYVDGTDQHAEWVHTTIELDRRRAAEGHAKYQPGRIYQPWEGLGVLILAAAFEPELNALIASIRREAGLGEQATWQQIVQQARQEGGAEP